MRRTPARKICIYENLADLSVPDLFKCYCMLKVDSNLCIPTVRRTLKLFY